jgi:hypothetical protein
VDLPFDALISFTPTAGGGKSLLGLPVRRWMGRWKFVCYICAVSVFFASTLRSFSTLRVLLSLICTSDLVPFSLPCGHFFLTAEAAQKKKKTWMHPFPPFLLPVFSVAGGLDNSSPPVPVQSTCYSFGYDWRQPRAYCRSATTHSKALARRC